MSGRTTDTRKRAITVALELFIEKGYDQASLREIAERLGITKAALYYHFPSKEVLLKAVLDSQLLSPVDELLHWIASQPEPRSLDTRRRLLTRIAEMVHDRWAPFVRFAQRNQLALQAHAGVTESFRTAAATLLTHLIDRESTLQNQLRSVLALVAIYVGNLSAGSDILKAVGIEASPEQLSIATVEVALDLIKPRRVSSTPPPLKPR